MVSFGGYYDTVNVVRYLMTAQDEYRGYRHVQSPEAFALHVFVKSLLFHVTRGDDRMILKGLLDEAALTRTGRHFGGRCISSRTADAQCTSCSATETPPV